MTCIIQENNSQTLDLWVFTKLKKIEKRILWKESTVRLLAPTAKRRSVTHTSRHKGVQNWNKNSLQLATLCPISLVTRTSQQAYETQTKCQGGTQQRIELTVLTVGGWRWLHSQPWENTCILPWTFLNNKWRGDKQKQEGCGMRACVRAYSVAAAPRWPEAKLSM
jgi:hypothetical protein